MEALTNINKLFLTTVFTLMPLIATSQEARDGGSAGGGANPVQAQFELARTYFLKALNNYNTKTAEKLTEKEKKIIEDNRERLIEDISEVELEFDHLTITPFKDINGVDLKGADAGLRTGGEHLAKIEVRRLVIAPKNEISIEKAISYFSHEIGHHFPPIQGRNKEQQAWDIQSALKQLLEAQMKAPRLLGIEGDYVSVAGPECRDQIHIEADPFTGRLSIASSTNFRSQNNNLCRIWMGAEFSPVSASGSFVFESVNNGDSFELVSSGAEETAKVYLLPNGPQVHYDLISRFGPKFRKVFDLQYSRAP